MRIANHAGRLVLIVETSPVRAVDVEKASAGRFGPDPQTVYDTWEDFTSWARTAPAGDAVEINPAELGAPVPSPAQVFGIGLNYADHAAESAFELPTVFPPVFTKFKTALAGPVSTVTLPAGGHTDWEVELVAVIGRRAEHVTAADAWSYVAGLTVGQDISERLTQLSGPAPQFSLGKSFAGFAPAGPWVVTPDEFADPDDLALGCALDGEIVQDGRTGQMHFSVPRLIEGLSRIVPLLPGDLVFTGTPAGVGMGRVPQRYIEPGQQLVSWVEGIGEIRQSFVSHVAADQATRP